MEKLERAVTITAVNPRGPGNLRAYSTVTTRACPASTELMGGGADLNTATGDPSVIRSEPSASGTGWSCTARNDRAAAWLAFDCTARCCVTPGR